MVGQVPPSGGRPPTLYLPPKTFVGTHSARPVLYFRTNWCLQPGIAQDVAAKGCSSADMPQADWHSSAYQFNQALQGVDISIGVGNTGAIGIDMNAAQGTTLENVGVYAAPDALAGEGGGNGGGGSFKGLTVVGANG